MQSSFACLMLSPSCGVFRDECVLLLRKLGERRCSSTSSRTRYSSSRPRGRRTSRCSRCRRRTGGACLLDPISLLACVLIFFHCRSIFFLLTYFCCFVPVLSVLRAFVYSVSRSAPCAALGGSVPVLSARHPSDATSSAPLTVTGVE